MNVGAVWTILASVLGTAASPGSRHAEAQVSAGEWAQRTPWGDLDLQGEWTSEGEFGVPLERPAEFGTREFLTDEEYAKRLADVAGTRRARSAEGRRVGGQGRGAERTDSALA